MPEPLAGETPLGPVELSWGHAGLFLCGTCFSDEYRSELYFVPTNDGRDPLSQGLHIQVIPPILDEPQTVTVELTLGTDTATTQGTLTLTAVPDAALLAELGPTSTRTPVWEGSLEIESEGWSVSGLFRAPICGAASQSVPCE